jgi:hypothetical protein
MPVKLVVIVEHPEREMRLAEDLVRRCKLLHGPRSARIINLNALTIGDWLFWLTRFNYITIVPYAISSWRDFFASQSRLVLNLCYERHITSFNKRLRIPSGHIIRNHVFHLVDSNNSGFLSEYIPDYMSISAKSPTKYTDSSLYYPRSSFQDNNHISLLFIENFSYLFLSKQNLRRRQAQGQQLKHIAIARYFSRKLFEYLLSDILNTMVSNPYVSITFRPRPSAPRNFYQQYFQNAIQYYNPQIDSTSLHQRFKVESTGSIYHQSIPYTAVVSNWSTSLNALRHFSPCTYVYKPQLARPKISRFIEDNFYSVVDEDVFPIQSLDGAIYKSRLHTPSSDKEKLSSLIDSSNALSLAYLDIAFAIPFMRKNSKPLAVIFFKYATLLLHAIKITIKILMK